jgi:hypothetical protein
MGRLTVRLPDTLHHQLTNLAGNEGVSLNQYIVYALTRQTTLAYTVQEVPKEKIEQERTSFEKLLKGLGLQATEEEIEEELADREIVEPGTELEQKAVKHLKRQMSEKRRLAA